MNDQDEDKNEVQLSNDEIDEISRDLGYSEETKDPINSSNPFITESELSKSTSQSIYSNDSLTKGSSKLETFSLGELIDRNFPPNKWIIDRLIPENGITCISGKPKAGKSFWALYLAICLASGNKFLEQFETQQGGVLFISKEDPQRLIQERVKLLNGGQDLPIHFCTDSQLFLDTDEFLKEIIAFIKEKNIRVVIIDSFRRIFKGEENSSQVVSDVHNRFKILLESGISLIFIHHHGKEGFFKKEAGDKLRGSSDILAMLDCLLIVERKDEQTLKISQGALRSDKQIESFLVKFPAFTDGDTDFKFLDYLEAEVEKIDHAKEDILLLLDSGMKSQTEIIQSLAPNGKYGPTTIKNALKELLESQIIDSIPDGNKKLYLRLESVSSQDEKEA